MLFLCHSDAMRTFIALDMPYLLKEDLVLVARSLQRVVKGRFVVRDNYHMTLAFLGEVPVGRLEGIQEMMDLARDHTKGHHNIVLKADRLGLFGCPQDATLWMGFAKEPSLMGLAQNLRDQLELCGFAREARPFLPHVTLARRVRLPKGELPPVPFPSLVRACQLTLFKSELYRTGPVYEALYSTPLMLPKDPRTECP